MHGAISVVKDDAGQSVDDMTDSSGSRPYVQAGFLLQLQEAAAPLRTYSKEFAWQS